MSNQNINEKELNYQEENKNIFPVSNNFTFSLICPKCHSPLTSQDFAQDHFTIAHLQDYFNQKEAEYKSQLLAQIEKNAETSPLFKQLKEENEKLKLIIEGYKLGTTKNSKTKGEELEKYILEQLQTTYNGSDEISKITHVGEKADIIHTIHKDNQQLAKIIYEIKNVDKWENKWLDKLEKDMVNEKADYGIIIATCRSGNPLWKPYPQKNILVSDEDNFLFASQMARLLVLSKQRLSQDASPEERIKKWEEWIKDKLPNYLLKLEKYFTEWEKDIVRINTSLKSMEKIKENIKNTIIGEMKEELKSI